MKVFFSHLSFPAPGGSGFVSPSAAGPKYDVALSAYTDETPARTVLDDQDGDTHPIDPVDGDTPKDRVRPGCKNLCVNIAGRLGINITSADVEEVPAS